ncbi:hypothetical protein B0H34DRAFT_851163 [Crassisporium funariophilum]|nr:hypothetical protein B0H34DRAFT_851163 [Crassisporium funariophilum]
MSSGRQNQSSLHVVPRRRSTVAPEGAIGGSPGAPGFATSDTSSGELTSESDSPRPQGLPIKVTTWRMLNTAFLLAVGTAKAASAYRGETTVPNTLDWVIGVIWALISYWFSILENEAPTAIPWLLEYDLYENGVIRIVFGYPLMYSIFMFLSPSKPRSPNPCYPQTKSYDVEPAVLRACEFQ